MNHDGEPAFPAEHLDQGSQTLRDWFAGMALTGIMATAPAEVQFLGKDVAELAYNLADAMIAEKEQREREADQYGNQT